MVDKTGIPGQGPVQNPKSIFSDHVVAVLDGVVYDASYGLKHDSLAKWEQDSVAGFATQHIAAGPPKVAKVLFAKNQPADEVEARSKLNYP